MKKPFKQGEKIKRVWGLANRLKYRIISGRHNVRKLRKRQ